MNKQELYESGIFDELADIRAHVCFGEGYVYVFSTSEARKACMGEGIPKAKGYQPGVAQATADGYLVKPYQILKCRRIPIPQDILDQLNPQLSDSTSAKGEKAEYTVSEMIKLGRIWLPTEIEPVTDKERQLEGIDLVVHTITKIQTKCDFRGGVLGTGNLYIQTDEINPLKRI